MISPQFARVEVAEAPNPLRLTRERNAGEAAAYEVNSSNTNVFRAAARLWRDGVPMARALKIVREAVNAAAR